MRSERGEITLAAVFLIFVAITLIVGVPLLTMADRTSDITQTVAQAVTNEIGNRIVQKKTITQEDIDDLYQLLPEEVLWDLQIQVLVSDANLGKKGIQVAKDKVGENSYYAIYLTDILKEIEEKGFYELKVSDILTITLTNESSSGVDQLTAVIEQGHKTYVVEYTSMI